MDIPPNLLLHLLPFLKKTGYIDLGKLPKVLVDEFKLRILSGTEVKHQMKMDYYESEK